MTPVAAVVLVIAAWVVLAAVMAWGLMRLDRADARRIDPRHPAAQEVAEVTVIEVIDGRVVEVREPDGTIIHIDLGLAPPGTIVSGDTVDATEWPADRLDALLAAMGIVAVGCVDLTDGTPPLTPDLVPVTDAEWADAVTRLLDASGRPEAES